ncbi:MULTISPECIES: hypothetical protein [unclassified Haladaptatus]|uniref:hypothetical protein n=1 Tax=unclassified Haladaptatus TaxID=2622732 RepID=UPI0023E8C37B|nr:MULTISPECIES: hypothetical protein [unclassified Haladaptatus]
MARQRTAVRGFGLAMITLACGGQVWLFTMVGTPAVGEWFLYLSPAFGLLGFVGFGTLLTSYMDR